MENLLKIVELRKMIKENKDNQELVEVLQEVQSELETGKAKVEINKLTNKDNKDKNELPQCKKCDYKR